MIFTILFLIFLLIIFWFVSIYNFFVSSKARIDASIQEIGNQLKRQSELIPNLEESVKGYLKHEKKIYENLTEARKAIANALNSKSLQEMADAGSKLSSILPNIQVIVEQNPELKGSQVVSKLMEELRDTADKLMYARRLLIDLVADYNVKRVTFPSSLVANFFGFSQMKGILLDDNLGTQARTLGAKELKTPKINLD